MSEYGAVPDPVFVQPHYDDVSLSCGGTVAVLAQTCSPLIITVFGGEASTPASAFARFQHDRWNLPDSAVVNSRRGEDATAARALGSTVRVRWFDYQDAIYRRLEYASDDALFGEPVPADRRLGPEIARRLSETGDTFYLPLAVGNHVDHQIVFNAARELSGSGAAVWLYADMPYALNAGAFRSRLADVAPGRRRDVELSPEVLERKWTAIECYRSQLSVLFRGMDDPRGLFEEFGRDAPDAVDVERFWRLRVTERASK